MTCKHRVNNSLSSLCIMFLYYFTKFATLDVPVTYSTTIDVILKLQACVCILFHCIISFCVAITYLPKKIDKIYSLVTTVIVFVFFLNNRFKWLSHSHQIGVILGFLPFKILIKRLTFLDILSVVSQNTLWVDIAISNV